MSGIGTASVRLFRAFIRVHCEKLFCPEELEDQGYISLP
jgi:hypothetical protein